MRNNSESAMLRMPSLLESRNCLLHFLDISRLKANPFKIFVNGDWMLSQSRTTSSRCDLLVLGTAKTDAQKEHFVVHKARKRRIKKDFDGIHDDVQRDPVYRDSQLNIGLTEEECIEMEKLAQEDHSYCPYSSRDNRKLVFAMNKSG